MLKVTKVWVHKYTSGKMLGFADVQFSLDGSDTSHMTWKGFKLFQDNDGGIQIGLPSRKDEKGEKDENGRIKYYPVVTITKEEEGGPGLDLFESIRSEIEKAYLSVDNQPETKNNSGNAGEPGDGLPF